MELKHPRARSSPFRFFGYGCLALLALAEAVSGTASAGPWALCGFALVWPWVAHRAPAADRLETALVLHVTECLVVGLLLTTLPLLWCLLRLVPPGPAADRLVKGWSRLALGLSGLSPRVTGTEYLEQAGSAVLVANHASYIDSLVLMAALPSEFRFIAKHALTSYPMIRTVIRRAQHVTIEKADLSRRLAGADLITQALRSGISLAVFPEGTFFRPPGVLPFRLGAFRAAVDARRPIVPITLRGTRDVLADGAWLLRRSPIDVTIGSPLVPEAQSWPEMVRLRDLARAAIARGAGEPLVDVGRG